MRGRAAIAVVLFSSVQIPVSLWFCTKDKSARKVKSERPQRNRKGEMLFIDARDLGYMENRTHRNLSPEDVARIADTYNAWRGDPDLPGYEDQIGFCASVTTHDVGNAGYALSPGRYVGTESAEDDGEPVEEKINRLADEIRDGFARRAELWSQIEQALDTLQVEE